MLNLNVSEASGFACIALFILLLLNFNSGPECPAKPSKAAIRLKYCPVSVQEKRSPFLFVEICSLS
ncbi:hypothetical protein PN498_03530 [Oscillatoria sp. CS-180]|uniref:hypothetical protein n=1 Tax=Oscillatoria sp. CS-180 TaxID=3021720 RepID=UPI00232B4A7A|nr:hypothetical protein [Oscillatoria sp. CS-180]MDB9525045.1 hypothetical protein [Oscillatoria sp. CS-180]